MNYATIKERRVLLGLTQQDLSDYTGLSLRIIKSIEACKANPSVATLSKIADVLGLELILKLKIPGDETGRDIYERRIGRIAYGNG